MRIVVCIKQVPDTTNVRINPKTNTLMREGVESIVNPFDEYALEEALRLKDAHGAHVTVITMGPPQATAVLREALARGADDAFLVSSRAFGGADTLATSYTLSQAIKKACGGKTPDPIGYFSRVRYADHPLHDLYNYLLPIVDGKLKRSGVKTGGGAEGDLFRRISPTPSRRFKPLSLWKKDCRFDDYHCLTDLPPEQIVERIETVLRQNRNTQNS